MLARLVCSRFRYVMSIIACMAAVAAYCVLTPYGTGWTIGSGVVGVVCGFLCGRLRRARLAYLDKITMVYLDGLIRRDVQ